MRTLFLIPLFVVALALAQRPTLSLEPLNWSGASSVELYSLFISADADLLYYPDLSDSYNAVVVIRRRNNQTGDYEPAANVTSMRHPVNSNGKWITLANQGVTLFSIDKDNKISHFSEIDTVDFGYILSDDTFVGCDPTNNTGNFTIRTFEYNASNNTWMNIPGTELVVTKKASVFSGKISTLRVSDTSLVIIGPNVNENVTIDIYARKEDKSWEFVESVPTNSSLGGLYGQVFYNGVDTLVQSSLGPDTSANASIGIVFIYTKINGKWIEQQFTPQSVGYRPLALFGIFILFTDPNTMFISAGLEGLIFSLPQNLTADHFGKVLMLTRNEEGLWVPKLDLIGSYGWFGAGMAVNDYDLFVTNSGTEKEVKFGIGVTMHTIPRCFSQPINVTCNNKQVATDCSEVPATDFYTIHNSLCGDVTATVTSLGLSDNHVLLAQVQFDRSYATTTYCNATVTCPAPPVTIQPVAPTRVSGTTILPLYFVMTCLLMIIIM